MRIGVMLSMPGDPTDVNGLIVRAQQAETAGFQSTWLPQVAGVDAMMTLALAGRETSTIELGTSVVPTYPRHPTVMAGQALTVQAASNGRFALGIGLSHKIAIENGLGLDYSKPIKHTREYLTILNTLLEQKRVEFSGELYRVNSQLAVTGATKPPVLVAALGPDMLKLCGKLADGTVTWMGGLNYLRDVAVPTMTAAALEAGKPSPRFVAMIPVLLTNDVASGREIINETFKVYGQLPSYRAALDRGGAATPADVAIIGSEEEIETQVRAYANVGVTDLAAAIPQVPGANPEATYDLFAALAKAK